MLHITVGVFYGKQPTISVCRRLLFYIISSSVQLSWAGARKLIFSVKVGLLSVRFKMRPRGWSLKASQAASKHLSSSSLWPVAGDTTCPTALPFEPLIVRFLVKGGCDSLTRTRTTMGSLAGHSPCCYKTSPWCHPSALLLRRSPQIMLGMAGIWVG